MVKLDLVFVELRPNYFCISIASIARLTNVRVNVIPPINISPSLMTWIPQSYRENVVAYLLYFALFSSSFFPKLGT